MDEGNMRRKSVLKTVEELMGKVGAKVGLNNRVESGTGQIGLGSTVGNWISDPLVLLLFGMLHNSQVLHSLYLETTTSLNAPLNFISAPHICWYIESISSILIYQTLQHLFKQE